MRGRLRVLCPKFVLNSTTDQLQIFINGCSVAVALLRSNSSIIIFFCARDSRQCRPTSTVIIRIYSNMLFRARKMKAIEHQQLPYDEISAFITFCANNRSSVQEFDFYTLFAVYRRIQSLLRVSGRLQGFPGRQNQITDSSVLTFRFIQDYTRLASIKMLLKCKSFSASVDVNLQKS